MAALKALVIRYPVTTYFSLTFAISWGGLLAVGGPGGLSGTVWQSDPRLPFLVAAMLAGPSVAGVLLTVIVSGREGMGELLARLWRWRVGARWYVIALLTAPIVFTGIHLALSLVWPAFLPAVFSTSDRTSLLLPALMGGLAAGFFEELGWTGFAVPRLRRRSGLFVTGVLVGVPWGAWHLLTNNIWIGSAFSGAVPISLFLVLNGLSLAVGQLPAYRVLMVWVYERTGSLLVAMLMHASLSACLIVFSPPVTGVVFLTYAFVVGAVWWIVVAVVVVAVCQAGAREFTERVPTRSPAQPTTPPTSAPSSG
jgi:membrane protease YdiL (CAAX protease family)